MGLRPCGAQQQGLSLDSDPFSVAKLRSLDSGNAAWTGKWIVKCEGSDPQWKWIRGGTIHSAFLPVLQEKTRLWRRRVLSLGHVIVWKRKLQGSRRLGDHYKTQPGERVAATTAFLLKTRGAERLQLQRRRLCRPGEPGPGLSSPTPPAA